MPLLLRCQANSIAIAATEFFCWTKANDSTLQLLQEKHRSKYEQPNHRLRLVVLAFFQHVVSVQQQHESSIIRQLRQFWQQLGVAQLAICQILQNPLAKQSFSFSLFLLPNDKMGCDAPSTVDSTDPDCRDGNVVFTSTVSITIE